MGPFHCFIKVLKLFRFSGDFISFGRPFQICAPIHDRLFDPNVVWLGLTWAKLFGFLNEQCENCIILYHKLNRMVVTATLDNHCSNQ